MCYHTSFKVSVEDLMNYFPGMVFDNPLDLLFAPVDHIAAPGVFPLQPIVYVHREEWNIHCRPMEWGIIRHNASSPPRPDERNKMVNIRSERILLDRSSYWYTIRNRRCLIPLTGTYEFRGIKGWKKKVPYHIRPAGDKLFFLPGLYSVARFVDKDTGEVQERWTFGLITRAANPLLRQIHNSGTHKHRMSLYLPLELAKEFLSEQLTESRYQEILEYEMPADQLEYDTVYSLMGKPRPDGLSKDSPWQWHEPVLGTMDPDE